MGPRSPSLMASARNGKRKDGEGQQRGGPGEDVDAAFKKRRRPRRPRCASATTSPTRNPTARSAAARSSLHIDPSSSRTRTPRSQQATTRLLNSLTEAPSPKPTTMSALSRAVDHFGHVSRKVGTLGLDYLQHTVEAGQTGSGFGPHALEEPAIGDHQQISRKDRLGEYPQVGEFANSAPMPPPPAPRAAASAA